MKRQRFSQRGKTADFAPRYRAIARHANTGSGCGAKFPASFARCLKNTHTKFEACSYNSFQDMRDLSQNFHFSAKWSLFSDPVTNRGRDRVREGERKTMGRKNVLREISEYKCLLHYGISMYTKHYTMQYNLVSYTYNKKSELK